MKKLVVALLISLILPQIGRANVTIEECVAAAEANYPLISKYDLISTTEQIELSDINKVWLPKIGIYAQASGQNAVPSFPSSLSGMMQQMGTNIEGLGKIQYKLGVDVNQSIWDGGATKTQRALTRARTESERAAITVELYAVRQRVESIYFAILLLESQIEQTESTANVLDMNLKKLRSMLANGTAMQCDIDMLEAQYLTLQQQIVKARSALRGYREMLSIFTGMDIQDFNLLLPTANVPENLNLNRPELSLFNSQLALQEAQREMINVSVKPKVGFFAQAYYGYPGIDYFKSMIGRKPSFNLLAGVRISWNIDSFYTRKNSLQKLEISNRQIETEKATFIFNSHLQTSQQLQAIEGLKQEMADDDRIVELRTNVRHAAESQLRNGVIDATALCAKINDETQASLTRAYHKIEYAKAVYNLKNTLNR